MKNLTYIFLLIMVAVVYSCKKKEEFSYDDRITSLTFANSNTRIINLAINDQLIVNGHPLTAFIIPVQGALQPNIGTLYFPTNGRFTYGSNYTIPQSLLTAGGTARVTMSWIAAAFQGGGVRDTSRSEWVTSTTFNTIDNQASPNDYYDAYYNLPNYANGGADSVFVFPRSVAATLVPTNIKIRVVNIGDRGSVSNLGGPVTLTYADGTPVSSTTTNVAMGKSSAYVEIPYGTYQFKVQTTAGAQIPGPLGINNDEIPTLNDPTTGMEVDGNGNSFNIVQSPMQSFEPGGTYSIEVSPSGSFVPSDDEDKEFINAFTTVADVSPTTNLTYARMEAVNAVAGDQVTVQVDGQALGSSLAFGANTGYQVYVRGTHDVKAVDQNGKVLAEQSITLTGNDVWTAWVYAAASGKTAMAFAFDNLSGNSYNPALGEGSYAITTNAYAPYVRFLNLCPNLPYATFTDQDGQPLQQNLAPGQVATTAVYTGNVPSAIRVYQSQLSPLVVPGNQLTNIVPLQPTDFIANKAVYSKGNFTGLPASAEPGVYTVALVGSLNGTAPANAHLIILKHNK